MACRGVRKVTALLPVTDKGLKDSGIMKSQVPQVWADVDYACMNICGILICHYINIQYNF